MIVYSADCIGEVQFEVMCFFVCFFFPTCRCVFIVAVKDISAVFQNTGLKGPETGKMVLSKTFSHHAFLPRSIITDLFTLT